MSGRLRKAGTTAWLTVGFAIWAVAAGSALVNASDHRVDRDKASQPPAARAQVGAPTTAAGSQAYVGEAKCLECHDEQRKGYEGSPHHRAADPRTPAAKQGCESCHGPGSPHVDDPAANPSRISSGCPQMRSTRRAPPATTAASTRCGTAASTKRAVVICMTCHSVHKPKSEREQLKARRRRPRCAPPAIATRSPSSIAPATCRCAKARWSARPATTSHGSTNVKLLRKGDSIAEMCTSCHADKRGPFLWEHRAEPRRLRDLPRSARLVERADAGRQAADALPAVSRRHAASRARSTTRR